LVKETNVDPQEDKCDLQEAARGQAQSSRGPVGPQEDQCDPQGDSVILT